MPTLQRRPRQAEEEYAGEQERPRQRQRRYGSDDSDEPVDEAGMIEGGERDDSNEAQLVKKLVRYAIACEYSRTPIRREGIREKVLGSHGRAFRKVFDGAQKQLRAVFGMEMVEMPLRDRSMLSVEEQRRAAKSQNKGPSSSNAYVLVTQLPESFRSAPIITPSRIPSADTEAIYVGLYSIVATIITLNGGELSDQKLKRYMQRMNANVNTPIEKTDVLLQRLIKQGYIVKTVNRNQQGDDDAVTWHVGPRGRKELTDEAMANIIREVYGATVANHDLERRLQASLRIQERKSCQHAPDEGLERWQDADEDVETANGQGS